MRIPTLSSTTRMGEDKLVAVGKSLGKRVLSPAAQGSEKDVESYGRRTAEVDVREGPGHPAAVASIDRNMTISSSYSATAPLSATRV